MRSCLAQDALARHQDCKPVEGKLNGRPQFYCAHCGRKMDWREEMKSPPTEIDNWADPCAPREGA